MLLGAILTKSQKQTASCLFRLTQNMDDTKVTNDENDTSSTMTESARRRREEGVALVNRAFNRSNQEDDENGTIDDINPMESFSGN